MVVLHRGVHARIRHARPGWLTEDPAQVAAWYRAGEGDVMDALWRYRVLLWGTGKLLPRSTGQFRAAMRRRAAAYWAPTDGAAAG